MTFSGDLRDINLTDVFQNIHANRLTGTVSITQVTGKRFVCFREGMVAGFSLGINRGLPIGDHLVQRQYVDRNALARASKRKTANKSSLREALASYGYLDADGFSEATQELVTEHLYDLLPVREAEFSFIEGKPVPRAFDAEQKGTELAIDPGAVLMEGARRADEMSRINQVIASDHDIFVMVEGWQEYELEGVPAEAAVWLDGRTEISTLVANLPHCRFHVLKAVYDLVLDDLARPLGNREMEDMAQEAVRSGHPEEAVALLNRALQAERNNDELRSHLADVLERSGRGDEAADELAILGYHAAESGDVAAAVEFYARAAKLKPRDVAMREKRVELLREHDPDGYVDSLLEFVDELQSAGLGEKARTVLKGAACDNKTEDVLRVRTRLAQIEADLGEYGTAAAIYIGIARQQRKTDVEGRLVWLRQAAELIPDDDALAAEIEDLESGRSERRRRARRRALAMMAMLCVTVGLGFAGFVELVASHRVIHTLTERMDRITAGRPDAALPDLRGVSRDYGWTLAGRHATALQERMFELQIREFERRLAHGETLAAVTGLVEFRDQTVDAQKLRRLDALVRRARAEIPVAALFARVNTDRPDQKATAKFARWRAPELVDFCVDRLMRTDGVVPSARQLILTVLKRMDHPRSMAAVALLFVHSELPSERETASVILRRAAKHRTAGQESAWADVYPELTAARSKPATVERAKQALQWLRGDK